MQQQTDSRDAHRTPPRYVGFWARFLAMIIDTIWTSILLGLLILAIFGTSFTAIDVTNPDLSAEMVRVAGQGAGGSFFAQSLLIALLIIGFWIWKGATPGKMVISAEIVDAKTLGKASPGQLIVRYVGYYISFIVFCLGFLWVAIDKRKQGWHDKIAGTVVVKT